MSMRLEMVQKSLVERLRVSSKKQQRNAARVACECVFQTVVVDVPIVIESLEQLNRGCEFTAEVISELHGLAEKLDMRYFDLQDRSDEGRGLDVEALQLFSQARAVSALALAGGELSLVSMAEAIYEASSAIDDGDSIFDTVLLSLSEA